MNILTILNSLEHESPHLDGWKAYGEGKYNDRGFRVFVERIGYGILDGKVYIQSPWAADKRYNADSKIGAIESALVHVTNSEDYYDFIKFNGKLEDLRDIVLGLSLVATADVYNIFITKRGYILLCDSAEFDFFLIKCGFFDFIKKLVRNGGVAKKISSTVFMGEYVVKQKAGRGSV